MYSAIVLECISYRLTGFYSPGDRHGGQVLDGYAGGAGGEAVRILAEVKSLLHTPRICVSAVAEETNHCTTTRKDSLTAAFVDVTSIMNGHPLDTDIQSILRPHRCHPQERSQFY